MNEAWPATLSRLLDDEDVDLEALADALETPEGRGLLLHFAALRRAARRDDSRPSDAFRARVEAALHQAAESPTKTSAAAGPPARWRYQVAAVLAAGLLLGAAAGTWFHRGTEGPPAANRVLRFEASEWTYAQGAGR